MTQKAKFGDVFEFKTAKGLAYLQYVNRDSYYGDLARVLDGFYETRPDSLRELAKKKEVYYFFILNFNLPVKWGELTYVGNEDIPPKFKVIPEFRMKSTFDPKKIKEDFWRIWRNGKEYKIGKMQKKYLDTPTLMVAGVADTISMLEEGYTPRNDSAVTGIINERLRERLRWRTDKEIKQEQLERNKHKELNDILEKE